MGAKLNKTISGEGPKRPQKHGLPCEGSQTRRARTRTASAVRVSLFPVPWQLERARLLTRLCKRIDQARGRGESIQAATRRLSRYWKPRYYRSAPARKV